MAPAPARSESDLKGTDRAVGARSYLECLVALGDSHGFAHTV